jgi:hypothetical protein
MDSLWMPFLGKSEVRSAKCVFECVVRSAECEHECGVRSAQCVFECLGRSAACVDAVTRTRSDPPHIAASTAVAGASRAMVRPALRTSHYALSPRFALSPHFALSRQFARGELEA